MVGPIFFGGKPVGISVDDKGEAAIVTVSTPYRDGDLLKKLGVAWDEKEPEMDDFAAQFQEFTGRDIHEIPEDARADMRARGVSRCRATVPCFITGPGTICECLQRVRKWVAFWKLVRFDQEDRLPTPLILATSPMEGPYHRPIFTFVCPGCRVGRSESYTRGYLGRVGEPALDESPATWLKVTAYTRPIELLRGHIHHSVGEFYVCSSECAKALNGGRWEERKINKLWEGIEILDSDDLDELAAAYDMSRGDVLPETDASLRNRLLKFRREYQRETERKRLAKIGEGLDSKTGEDLDELAKASGVVRWEEESDEQLRFRVKEWARNEKKGGI